MKKKSSFKAGFFGLRVVVALLLCSVGAGLALFALSAPQHLSSGSRFTRLGSSGNSASASEKAFITASKSGPFGPEVSRSIANATSNAIRDLPLASAAPQAPHIEHELGPVHSARPVPPGFVDPVRQSLQGLLAMPGPIANFEGQTADDSGCGCIPPDTNGAVGPTQYVQMVNSSLAVYNKTGTRISGPTQINALFNALPAGNQCRVNNNGDPVVVYDQLANRWLVSQFAVPGGANGYHECIAISQTGDATGAYYVYDFLIGNATKFQDYPHFGLWPDGYYMSTHQFDPSNYIGAGVFAFERAKMLAGQPAQMVYFDLNNVNPAFGGHLPATLDGFTLPPTGAPNYFVEVDDSADIGPVDAMRIWKFHVDWMTPMNSTFGLNGQPNFVVPVADFTRPPCLLGLDQGNCVPQPASETQLDPIGDRLMYRLAYRNFGDHESLVVNHTVVASATTMQHGPRWYEVRNPGGSPTIFQQGTLAPSGITDLLHRWMGSIAMDHSGNIAIGYSTSSNTDFPSIAYAGRLATDPPNQLSQGEVQMFAGGASENPFLFIGLGLGRWGDYSDMTVDPTDDCTFWYTTEYFPTPIDPFTTWHTRIGSFKFPQCVPITTPLSVVSRKTHAGAGTYDIPLPGVECRSGGANGDHDIVFTFAAPVAPGTATCGGNAASTNASGNEITVHCTGIANAQAVNVTLNGSPVVMSVLLGDTNADASVNSADIGQTKSQSGLNVTGSNFREDVNVDGSLNSADISLVKSKSGTALP